VAGRPATALDALRLADLPECGAQSDRSSGPGAPGTRTARAASSRTIWIVAAAVGILAAACYLATLRDYGPVSDEANYFVSSRLIAGWTGLFARSLVHGEPGRAFTDAALDESWRWLAPRIPHPPFSRELAAVSDALFRHVTDLVTGYRILDVLVAALLAGGVAAWAALRAGPAAGGSAGAAFLLMPRVFAHAHFADTDLVLSALVFFALFCAAEARRRPLAWAGLLWGLALATKLSAILLPAALLPWLVAFRRDALRQLPLFGVLALVAFVAVNPLAWVHPVETLTEYVRQGTARRHLEIAQLPTVYFGRLYTYRPPWHYPLVMLAITAPIGISLLWIAGGAAGLARRATRPVAALALLVTAAFLGALELPSAPMHDDIRLFLPVFPFLALLAGLGAGWLLSGRLVPRMAAVALVALALGDAAVATARMHPYQGSYFNVLVGGVAGADRRGLEVTGMKEVLTREVYADLNRILPRGAKVDGGPFLYEDLLFAQALGWLEPGLTVVEGQPSDYVLLVNRPGWFRPMDRALLRQGHPSYTVSLEGVPLVALYRLR
jgi:4-amino-4-deoxy-L-arabinose transferase-like glycosyltransferase